MAEIKAVIAVLPTYGCRRVHAILKCQALDAVHKLPNHKRFHRAMKAHTSLIFRAAMRKFQVTNFNRCFSIKKKTIVGEREMKQLHIWHRLSRATPFAAALCIALLNPAEAKDDNFIRFTTDTSSTSLPIWYAEENGLFAKHGLKYSDTIVNAGYLGLQAIGAGENDASIQSDLPTVINIAAGVDAIIVAVLIKSNKGFALVAKKPFQNVEDLKGKKVAWLAGSGGELSFSKYLHAKGLSLSDFDHINLQPAEAVPSLVSGGIDAIWFWQPWPRKAVALDPGDLRILAYSDPKYYEATLVLTVGRSFAAEKPETLKRFLGVLIESVNLLNEDPKAASILLSKSHAHVG